MSLMTPSRLKVLLHCYVKHLLNVPFPETTFAIPEAK